ncbi:MAG: hypothetical protein GX410_07785 [Elusimicrobia bacterium]|nr:hypothetical protein [Elusimicrobiota bacterium]
MLTLCAGPALASRSSSGQKRDAARLKTLPSAAPQAAYALPLTVRQQALAAEKALSPWQVRFRPDSAVPRTLKGGQNMFYVGDPVAAAKRFLEENKGYLQLDPAQLQLENSKKALGITHLLFRQYYNGLPVDNASVKVHIDEQGRVIYYSSTHAESLASATSAPAMSKASAISRTRADGASVTADNGKLVYFRSPVDNKTYLAWKIESGEETGAEPWRYYINASNGEVLFRESLRRYAVSGTIQGHVYADYPRNADFSDCSTVTIRNQYVWIQGYSTRTVTGSAGTFSFSQDGKIFASLKGPYIAVSNNMGRSAHYDTGSGTWSSCLLNPANPSVLNYTPGTSTEPLLYVTTVTFPYATAYFSKAEIRMAANFQLGTVAEYDSLLFLNPASGERMAAYFGNRVNAFTGPQIENPNFVLQLESHGGEGNPGFTVAGANCLTLSNPTVSAAADGSFTWNYSRITPWATTKGTFRNMAEVNIFYHLNELHDYINNGVNSSGLINLNTTVPILAEANPEQDNMAEGYDNGFYSVPNKMLVLGNGYYDYSLSNYRSMGLDSPTLRHEYVHFMQDRVFTAPYFAEAGAIQEALSDYFALSSMQKTAPNPNKDPLGSLIGAFAFPYAIRNLESDCGAASPSNCAIYSTSTWVSEVHDDSPPLSQSFWELRNSSYTATWLGLRAEGPRADTFIFQSLFFFPETFLEFRDIMEMVCDKLEGTASCSANYLPKIALAFSGHNITSPLSGTDSYEPNNGITLAANISTSPFSATINPQYDLDYYSVSAPTGTITVSINYPSSEQHPNTYHAYMVTIKDPYDHLLSENIPMLDPDSRSSGGNCPASGECFTRMSSMTVTQALPYSGRYVIMVCAAPVDLGGNSPDISTSPYTLSLSYNKGGSLDASIIGATYDNDLFSFSVPYNTYDYAGTLSWVSTMTARVENYEKAALLDINGTALAEADTETGGLLETVSVSTTEVSGRITGSIRLKTGFAQRYPSVGTVMLEVFGRTRQDQIVSLGVSAPLNITANTSSVMLWNNIFTPDASGRCSQFGSDCLTIAYSIVSGGTVTAKIYSRDGTLINTLSSSAASAGKGNFYWNGTNSTGNTVASGLYIVKISGPGLSATKKVVVVK